MDDSALGLSARRAEGGIQEDEQYSHCPARPIPLDAALQIGTILPAYDGGLVAPSRARSQT